MNQHLSSVLRPCILAVAAMAATVVPSKAATCGSLSTALLPDIKVDLAVDVAPGAFVPPPSPGQPAGAPAANPSANLPSFCRVTATVRPSSEAPIRIEVWLPANAWNSRLRAVGNDGFYNAAPIGFAAL